MKGLTVGTILVVIGLMADLAGLGVPIKIWPLVRSIPATVQPTTPASNELPKTGGGANSGGESDQTTQQVAEGLSAIARVSVFLPIEISNLAARGDLSVVHFVDGKSVTVRRDVSPGKAEVMIIPNNASYLKLELFPTSSRYRFLPETVTGPRPVKVRFLLPQDWEGDLIITHESQGTMAQTRFGPNTLPPLATLLSDFYRYELTFAALLGERKLPILLEGNVSIPNTHADFEINLTNIEISPKIAKSTSNEVEQNSVKISIFSRNNSGTVKIRDSNNNLVFFMEFGPQMTQKVNLPPGNYVIDMIGPISQNADNSNLPILMHENFTIFPYEQEISLIIDKNKMIILR